MSNVLPITRWYEQYKRDLPWRHTADPYLIWLSEVILQQTRVEQGLPYYYKFTERYKTVRELAAANDADVMKLWQGLGYYSRAVNMLKTARLVVDEHKGVFPGTYDELVKLKGIGPYTAAAIASFAFNEPKAVLDGNVYRVLSRVFAIDEPINSTKGKKIFTDLAAEVLDHRQPALYNQAIMELGAIICKPRQPLCLDCPLRLKCLAYEKGAIEKYPVKLKKNPPRDRFLNYLVLIDKKEQTFIRQRTEKGIWHMLYEPPVIESTKPLEEPELLNHEIFKNMAGNGFRSIEKNFSTKHQLTHQTIYADFWVIRFDKTLPKLPAGYIRTSWDELEAYAVPRLFEKFFNYHKLRQ